MQQRLMLKTPYRMPRFSQRMWSLRLSLCLAWKLLQHPRKEPLYLSMNIHVKMYCIYILFVVIIIGNLAFYVFLNENDTYTRVTIQLGTEQWDKQSKREKKYKNHLKCWEPANAQIIWKPGFCACLCKECLFIFYRHHCPNSHSYAINQWWFCYSIITLSYTKYFVHSFTVDVVFTLSYLLYHDYQKCH